MINESASETLMSGHGAANSIDGWMSDKELEWLAAIARESEIIIEIGSYKGRSTRALADNCIGRVYAIDPWNGVYYSDDGSVNTDINTDVFEQFYNNLKDHIESKRVTVLQGFSKEFSFWNCADLVFIDGDHRYDEVIADIERAKRWIRNGGVIAGHDYNQTGWPSVKRAVDASFSHFNVLDTIWHTQILK